MILPAWTPRRFLFLFCFAALCGVSFAEGSQKLPQLGGRLVVDQAQVLSAPQVHRLEQALGAIAQQGGPQIGIFSLEDLGDEPIEAFSIRLAEAWQLGNKKRDDGLIITIAVNQRAMRIEVGQGLEGDIPDLIAKRVIDGVLVPAFQKGDFFGGLSQASYLLLERVDSSWAQNLEKQLGVQAGTSSRSLARKHQLSVGETIVILVLLLVFLLFFTMTPIGRVLLMGFMLGRSSHYRRGGSWGSGGGLGGGFGGGGGFSGGGASGRW